MSDIVKRLHDDGLFNHAISSVGDEEKKRIVGITEAFVSELDAAFQLALQRIKDDASLGTKLTEALTESWVVLSGSTEG